jgi:hypothetical protein
MASHRWRALAPLFVLVVLAALISVANPNFIEVRNLFGIGAAHFGHGDDLHHPTRQHRFVRRGGRLAFGDGAGAFGGK